MPTDLDRVERVINRPHVIDLREDGWTIMHPPACHPWLFECPVNQDAIQALTVRPSQAPGRYECGLNDDDEFVIGDPAADSEGVDWSALVAELRAARTDNERLRTSENDWEDFLQRLETELHRIAERFPADGYPDGDLAHTLRQASPVAALEHVSYLIGKQQVELRAAREAVRALRSFSGLVIPEHVREGDGTCGCPLEAHPTASIVAAYDKLTGEATDA